MKSDHNKTRIEVLKQSVDSLKQQIRELRGIIQSDYAPAEPSKDPLYEDAVEVVQDAGMASPALLQRELKIGYQRADNLIKLLHERGVIGPEDGARPRAVLK